MIGECYNPAANTRSVIPFTPFLNPCKHHANYFQPVLLMSMPAPELTREIIDTANDLADIAREVTLGWFRRKTDVDSKQDRSPVTIADRETEHRMRELIESRFPDHGIFGEEYGVKSGQSEWLWTLDPIDGTKSFVSGKPTFGSLIALRFGSDNLLGIIEMPALGERWLGIAGDQTCFNQQACRTSETRDLEDAVLLCTTPDMFNQAEWGIFNVVSNRARVRNFGTDCLGYGLLASGHTDIVMEADLKPYDYLALIPIVQGAGGIITDWQGEPLNDSCDGRVLACANQVLHSQALDMIAEASGQVAS